MPAVRYTLLALAMTLCTVQLVFAEVRTRSGKPLSNEVEADPSTGDHLVVWVASDQFVPAELPGPQGRPVADGRKFKFMESAALSKDLDQVGDTTYRMLVTPGPDGTTVATHWGWIDQRLLVMRNQAEKDSATEVYRKVMIVNSQEDLAGSAEYSHLVPIRLAPQPAAQHAEPCRLFQLFFKWGEIHSPQGGDYVLIGAADQFSMVSAREGIAQLVLGWVPTSRICRWDTREALYWDRDSTLPGSLARRSVRGHVWRTPEDAHAALPYVVKGSPEFGSIRFLAREAFDDQNQSAPTPAREMRFPILEFTRSEREALAQKFGGNPDWELLRVGIVGDFVDETGKLVASRSQMAEYQEQLRSLQEQMKRIEVLFVIDDTSSMAPWFGRTADTVQQIAATVRAQKHLDVRVGIAFYNDTDGQPQNHDPVSVVPLVNPASAQGTKLIETLRSHKTLDGGDAPEKLYEALVRGTQEAGFSPYARKMLIVLGDAGDHAGTDARRLAEVAAALSPPRQSPFDLSAILVLSEREAAVREAARSFTWQMQTLGTQLNSGSKDRQRAAFATIDDAGQVEVQVLGGYQSLIKQSEAVQGQLAELARGQWGRTQLAGDIQAAIKRRGTVDLDRLLTTKGGVQLFEQGYVWIRKSLEQDRQSPDPFSHLLLLGGADIDDMVKFLKGLEIPRQQVGSADPLAIIKKAIYDQVGEVRPEASWQSAVLKSRGLTVLSPLLNRQIQSARPGTFRLKDIFELEHKRYLLEDLASGQRFKYDPQKEDVGGVAYDRFVRAGTPQPEQRSFHFGELRNVNWYWVDKHKEWP